MSEQQAPQGALSQATGKHTDAHTRTHCPPTCLCFQGIRLARPSVALVRRTQAKQPAMGCVLQTSDTQRRSVPSCQPWWQMPRLGVC